MPKLYAWKFKIPFNKPQPWPEDPGISFEGCFAVAVAPTEDEARGALKRAMNADGDDSRWLDKGCAHVSRIEIDGTAAIGWALV